MQGSLWGYCNDVDSQYIYIYTYIHTEKYMYKCTSQISMDHAKEGFGRSVSTLKWRLFRVKL